jgi:pyruvate kinase
VFTRTGLLARIASWLRPRSSPIYAFSDRETLARQLSLLRGVEPMVMPACQDDPAGSVEGALHRLLESGRVKRGDSVVVVLPHPSSFDHEVESIKMHVIG